MVSGAWVARAAEEAARAVADDGGVFLLRVFRRLADVLDRQAPRGVVPLPERAVTSFRKRFEHNDPGISRMGPSP